MTFWKFIHFKLVTKKKYFPIKDTSYLVTKFNLKSKTMKTPKSTLFELFFKSFVLLI